MKERLARGVVWQDSRLAIQEVKIDDETSVFGFPGAVVLPGEKPNNVVRADLTRKLGFNFWGVGLGDEKTIENDMHQAFFYEVRLPTDSISGRAAGRSMVKLWYMDELMMAMQSNLLAPLSADYVEREFINGIINN